MKPLVAARRELASLESRRGGSGGHCRESRWPTTGPTLGTLIVLAKQPVPGRVKTRLVPPLNHVQAAYIAGGALMDTLRAVGASPAHRRLLAFDGCPDGWLPDGWLLSGQPDGGLDRRLIAAFGAAGSGPALLVGMDTPQLRPDHLARFDPVRHDACLGLARDGGYWALGFRDPRLARAAIDAIPMSTAETGARQLRRLRMLGLRVQLLDELTDVDTIDDADEVASSAPDGAFTRAMASVSATRTATRTKRAS